MNKAFLVGNLTRDPELTTTANGISVCRFTIAVSRRFSNSEGEREADFLNCIAWRGLADNVAKYVKKGKVDPQKFSDFFSPKLFPNCKPEVAALYAANDAKITYELFIWQLPYVTKTDEKCKKHHLEKIADLIWHLEFPIVKVCARLHRRGIYLDDSIAIALHDRYTDQLHKDEQILAEEVQKLIDVKDTAINKKRPFRTGKDFNPNSNPHVKYLVNVLLGNSAKSFGKEVLTELNVPVTKAILAVRGDVKLLSTYVDKLPRIVAPDHRIHASFKALGAATGRMCVAEGQFVNTLWGHKRIETVVPGDIVFCYDEDKDEVVQSKVINTWKTGQDKECVVIKYRRHIDNKCPQWLHCTPEHLIYTKNCGWKEAKQLVQGDILLYIINFGRNSTFDEEGFKYIKYEEYEVDCVQSDKKKHNVYDIEVENYHNFFASDILIHNSSENPNAQNIPSKSHDIRHLFRATPEQTEKISILTDESNVATFVLSLYDSIPTTEGLTKVNELQEGNTIVMNHNDENVNMTITSITSKLDKATIVVERR